jgi:hypothetical protein
MAAPEVPADPPPELEPVQALFDAGDYRKATRVLAEIEAAHPQGPVAEAAATFRARLAPDPWAMGFGLATLALLLFSIGAYVL